MMVEASDYQDWRGRPRWFKRVHIEKVKPQSLVRLSYYDLALIRLRENALLYNVNKRIERLNSRESRLVANARAMTGNIDRSLAKHTLPTRTKHELRIRRDNILRHVTTRRKNIDEARKDWQQRRRVIHDNQQALKNEYNIRIETGGTLP